MNASGPTTNITTLLSSLMEGIVLQTQKDNPSLAEWMFRCAVARWFDAQIAAGLCLHNDEQSSSNAEVEHMLQDLPFCERHPTRPNTWMFEKEFRALLLTQREIVANLEKLHTCAARVFKRILDNKSLAGEQRFQDEDWRLVAVEWLYHLLQVDQEAGLAVLTTMCAEALAIPVYEGPSWEIDFCVRLLADLEWPSDAESLNLAIGDLKKGFGNLAAGQNAKALVMVKQLANIPGLTPEQVGELHYFAAITHLYDEGKMGLALQELEKAVQLIPNRAKVHAAIASVHFQPGTIWGRLDLAEQSAREAIQQEQMQAEGHVALGRLHEQQEDWEQAIACYQNAIDVEPSDTEGYLALSDAYTARREVAKAIGLVDKVWQISSGREYYASIRKGNVFSGVRDFKNARLEYEKAITLGPDQLATYIALGGFHEQIDEISEAAEMYNKAIKLDPTVEDGYVALARLYHGQGKLQKAIETCQKCLANGVAGKGIYIVLSNLYDQQERLTDLEEVWEKIVALDSSEHYSSYCAVGRAWLAKASKHRSSPDKPTWLAQAQAKFEKAIELDKNRAWAYLSLGELHVLRGEYNQLDEIERLVVTYAPWAQYDLLVGFGQACLGNYEGKRCEMFLDRAVNLAPHRIAGWLALGDLYTWQGDSVGVAKAWQQAIKIDPALYYDSHFALGTVYMRMEDYARARQEFSEAVELEPNTARGYWWLGAVAEAEGNQDEAIEQYQIAAEKASGLAPLALTNIAQLQREQQQLLAAERTLRRAINLDPDQAEPYLELARLGALCDRQSLVTEASDRIASALPDQIYDFYNTLADAYRSVGRFDDAKKVFDQCRELDPDRADAYVGLAQVLVDQEQQVEARKVITKAIAVDRTAIGAYVILSRLCEAENDVDGVISAQQRIVELAPTERYNACINIGGGYEKVDQVVPAEQQYREALASCPWRSDAYFVLGSLLAQLGRSSEAEEISGRAKTSAIFGGLDIGVGIYLEAGQRWERRKEPDKAIREYERAIAVNPQRPEGYGALGQLLVAQERLGDAIQVCQRMAQQPELAYNAYISLGDLLSEKKAFEEAEKAYRQAIEVNPESQDAYLQLGQFLLDRKRLDDAIQVCERMAQQPELSYNAYISLGNLLVEKKAYEEAEKAYHQAIELTPEVQDAYVQLGQLLVEQKRPDDAVLVYWQMAKQPKLAWMAHVQLGDLWLSSEKYKEAEKSYRQAIKADRQQPTGYLRLAQLYRQQGALSKAEKPIQDAMKVALDSPDPYIVLAQLREQQGRVDDAIALYRQVAQLKPSEASAAYERIGDILIDKERHDEALIALQQAVQKDPVNAGAYFSLGMIYEQQASLEQAIAMYSKVLDANPKYFTAYAALARIYGQQKAIAKIANLAKQYLGQNLQSTELYDAHMAIGVAYQTAQTLEWAMDEYRTALDLDPKRTDAYLAQGQIYEIQKRWADARNIYVKLDELVPEWKPDVHRKLGDLYALEGVPSEAEREYRKVITLAPERSEGYTALAQLYMTGEEWHKAAEMWEQLTHLKDIDPVATCSAYLYLADIRRTLHDMEGMLAACSQVINLVGAIKSPNPDLLRQKGLAFFMQGKYDKASESLMYCLEADPGDVKAHFYLALNLLCQGNRTASDRRLEQGRACIKDGVEFGSAIREAEVLVAHTPEIVGAKEILDTLKKLATNAV